MSETKALSEDDLRALVFKLSVQVGIIPELVEALADTLRMLEAAYRTLGMYHDDSKRIAKARAALARAKGAS